MGIGKPRVYVRVWGLVEEGYVDITCGRLGLGQALLYLFRVETAATGFTVRIEGSGAVRLPIESWGVWICEAAAPDYGEVPETYRITVGPGSNITLDYYLGLPMPLRKDFSQLGVGVGDKIGLIGRIEDMGNGTYALVAYEGGRIHQAFPLRPGKADPAMYVGEKVWVLAELVQEEPPVLRAEIIVRPGQPGW